MRVSRPNHWAALGAALVLAACPATEEPPAAVPSRPAGAAAGGDQVMTPADSAAARAETQLVREVFAYRGGGRDPFISLVQSGEVRPLFEDLRVTTINYNERYPSASIAILRDMSVNRRYTVRVGDELGRLRVAQIRRNEVIVVVEEFGVEREESLRMRRRQEGIP